MQFTEVMENLFKFQREKSAKSHPYPQLNYYV